MTVLRYAVAALALWPVGAWAKQIGATEEWLRDGAKGCGPMPCSEDGECLAVCRIRTDIIVTATGSQQVSDRTGLAVTRIEADDLKRLQIPSVSDLLSTTPGVTVSRNGGPGGFAAVRIRGAEGEQTLTLIDGIRVNDPSSPGGGFDFGNLLLGNINRIEVLRGPNSVPWGSQAIGGVVNIVTASPDNGFAGQARAEYGFKDAVNAVGQIATGSGRISASLGGGYFRDDGVSAFKDGRERDGYRQYAANGRLSARISDAFDLDVRGYYANSRAKADGFPPPFFGFADTPEFSKTEQLFTYAGANVRLFKGKLKNRFAWTRAATDRDNFDAPGQATPSFLARGRVNRFEYQGNAKLGYSIRAVIGAEHEQSRFTDGFSPAKTRSTSGYGQLILDPVDSVTLTGGVRIDDYKSYGTRTTVSGNAVWRVGGRTVIRAAYGEGFKAPTLFQLFSFFGNRALKPESATSYEIGFEQGVQGVDLSFGATLFQRDTRNQIDFASCPANVAPSCSSFGAYLNVDRTRARGVETFLRVKPVSELSLDINYSYIDSEDRVTGLTLLRRPKHNLNVAVDWEVSYRLKVGASLRLASDSADSDFQTFSRTRLDGYALASLRASVPINDSLEFYGRVENLFNERYETVSGYGTYGRNAHIGVRAKF